MAVTNNPLLIGLSGSIGKQIVFKNYGHYTVVTKYPDMSRVIRTPLQKRKNRIFAQAVLFAQSILHDPEKLLEYKSTLKPGERVYNAAIREYMNSNKEIGDSRPDKKAEYKNDPINTKDEIRNDVINTKDERRNDVINTKDERSAAFINVKQQKALIKTGKKWRMKHPFERDAHPPPSNSLNIKRFVGLPV